MASYHYFCCSHWERGQDRCRSPATVWLYAPGGKRVPGGYLCWPCAREIAAEYAEKLGQIWPIRGINEDGTEAENQTRERTTELQGTEVFEDRVRFKWGFHDGTLHAEQNWTRQAPSTDLLYEAGFAAGRESYNTCGRRDSTSDLAWDQYTRAQSRPNHSSSGQDCSSGARSETLLGVAAG